MQEPFYIGMVKAVSLVTICALGLIGCVMVLDLNTRAVASKSESCGAYIPALLPEPPEVAILSNEQIANKAELATALINNINEFKVWSNTINSLNRRAYDRYIATCK